ncbi:MAG: protein kinase [Parachlamydiales bacterium]|nr:protein kinase [Parachlamydiales bacterium]
MTQYNIYTQKTVPNLVLNEKLPAYCPSYIGPYKIESIFSKGGMSILYLGIHPETGTPLLVKVLSPKHMRNKEVVGRFFKEAKIIAMTDHPNIIKLYGHGKWEKGLYIAMELIQGVSLRQFILQKSLSKKRALEIILQVAYALCHLHTHGVIHRDLKPENILITESGDIKVIDFGIAQLQGEIEERNSRRVIGTPAYMSPEQIENPSTLSYASDIFSLGIIAYELILGRLSHGVIQLALLPKGLRDIIDKALKIDPKERYQDIVDFITSISEYLNVNDEKEPQEADEIVEALLSSQKTFLQKQSPTWTQIEVGLATQNGLSLTGQYLDFFKLPENRYIILLAEPEKEGVESLIFTSTFRGMARMIIDHYFLSPNNDLHPVTVLNILNETLSKDPQKQPISLSLLLLNPEKNQLSYVSCGHNDLWHIPVHTEKIINLRTPNQKLGHDLNSTLVETANNWHVGDILILPSLAVTHENNEENFKQLLLKNLRYSPRQQAKKIMQGVKSSPFAGRNSTVLCIQRAF